LAQLPLALSLLVVGAVSRRTVTQLDRNSQDILKDNYLSVLAAQRMRDSADAMARAALAHAAERALPAAAARERCRQTFERELKFQESNITEIGEREMTERLRGHWTVFQHQFDQLMETAPTTARDTYFTQLEPTLIALEEATNDITAVNQDAMVRKSERARASSVELSGVIVVVTFAAFLIGILASSYLTNRLTRPLFVLAQAVRRLGQGDLAARARIEGKDEIGQVATEFNTMAGRLAQYRASSLGELLQTQQAAQAAIDSLPDPVIILDTTGALLNVNRAAETLLGLSTETITEPLGAVESIVRDTILRMREHVLGGRGAFVPRGFDEALAVPTHEGPHYLLPRANPVTAEGGASVGVSIVLQDVTRLRRFDELKTDMVATVAHEFRTPLTSLRMAIHLCIEGTVGPLTDKQLDLLYGAREDCERLQGIVDDVLDLSRISGGQIDLHLRAVSSATLLQRALDQHRAQAKEARVALDLTPLTVDKRVLADPERIDLVLTNLLQNAIRHTPPQGHIEMRAAPERDSVRFEVSDTGPGIAREYVPRIFERFFRVPGADGGSAGLGLYICKEIVEAHGGTIGVESDPGQGAIFWFTIPAAQGSSLSSSSS
jgi:signal transduction histidine kinase/HAMP domain-containing protein